MDEHNTVSRTDKPTSARKVLSHLFTWRSAIADSDLKPRDRHVALTLSLHMSERGDSCFPSMTTLAAETGYGVSTVRDAMASLAEKGWIDRQITHGRGRSNRYTATVPENRQIPAVSGEVKPPDGVVENRREAGTEDVHLEDVHQDLAAAPRERARTPRDDLWDALSEIFGDAVTRNGRSLRGKTVTSLMEARATPDQIRAAPKLWRRVMPAGATFTETALDKHWSLLMREYEPAPQAACPECGVGAGMHSIDCPTRAAEWSEL